MMRRIEITRETWTRLRVQGIAGSICPRCRTAEDLMPFREAARAALVLPDRLELAVRTGLVAVCDGPDGSLVCLGCIRDLLANKKLP